MGQSNDAENTAIEFAEWIREAEPEKNGYGTPYWELWLTNGISTEELYTIFLHEKETNREY